MILRAAGLALATAAACASSGEPAAPPSHTNPTPAATTAPVPTVASAHAAPAPTPSSSAMTSTPPPASTAAPILSAATDSIQYAVGNPSFRGRTVVKVTGSGAVDVSFERGGKTDRYTGQLDADELRGLRDNLASHDPRALHSARATGKPDEARIELTIRGTAGDSQVTLWDGEQWQIPSLRALVVAFNAIASKTSGGKVKY